MEGGPDGYNKRHAAPCCATIGALVGMSVTGFLVLCLSSYKIGGVGMFGLLLAIAGTILESWSCYTTFKNPRKAQKKRIVSFLGVIFVGMFVYVVFVTIKKNWTHVVKSGVALSCAFMLGAGGVAIWAFRLPSPTDRVDVVTQEAPRAGPGQADLEPPPVIENASNEETEKVVEIHFISPYFGSEKVVQWDKGEDDEKADEGALNTVHNLPVGDPIEFPASVYEDANASDEPLDIV